MARQGFRDMLFSVVMVVLGGILWRETTKPNYQASGIQDYGFDPAFFPRILIVLWLVVAVMLLLQSFKAWRKPAEDQNWWRLSGSVALAIAYVLLMNSVGFLFSSIPFVALMLYLLGFRRPVFALIALLFPLVTWYVFVFLLQILLPISPWFSRV